MGFASRSVSMMRYFVRGELEGAFRESIEDGLKRGAFREVESSGDMVGMGWTSIDDFTDSRFENSAHVIGSYVLFSLRVDSVRVPPRILEIQYRTESKKILEETGKRRLSSSQRRELREQIKESLKQRAFPSIQVFDLIWNTSDGIVYFGTHGVRARERMEDLFKKSFGLTLAPAIPYIKAQQILIDEADKKRLEELKPCSMAP